jgi:RNA polymerase sigma-70 factor (ECF subfamily)
VVTELFEQYAAPLCSYLHFLVGDLETAYDLTQETFLRIVRTQHQLAAVENQRAWLYRIATNLAHNHRRRQERFAWIPWHKVDYAQQPPDEGVEKQFATRQIVEKCLAHLPLIYRAPLLLHVDHGFTVREVASMLEIGEGAVKTRLWRGRELFRLTYEKETQEQEERAQHAKATS